MSLLDEDERETANWYRQEKMRKKYGLSLTVVDRVVVTASVTIYPYKCKRAGNKCS